MSDKKFVIPMPVRYVINTVLLVVFLVAANAVMQSGALGRAQTAIIIQIGFFIILAVSLNIVTGYLGQLPLGHAGFMAVGAYAGAIFWRAGMLPGAANMIMGFFVAGIVAAIFGLLIGIPALRFKGDYLAIITLGFGEIIRVLLNNLDWLTNGARGLLGIPRYSNFLVVYICVIITCAFIHVMMKSRHGRAILSIRDNEIAAESCGVNTVYYKVAAFVVSAFFAGIAGALFAGNFGILIPGDFDFMMSINILMIVVLGGLGSMFGSIVAAAVLTYLPFALQSSESVAFLADYRMIIYSLLLILMMIFKPSGLMGSYDFSMSRILEKIINFVIEKKGGKKDVAS
ncbi:MAG: branched-chain amino acid ABC transporter permease [Defluviitaleaceae bacterium]|nr:branched-chain amino acid ABC transporter permease [Defluviitaleaceae bacterium]MCL2264298.1 branched-chain amino acid ABC transporter permease [Defluviitaleaceae bacterium]